MIPGTEGDHLLDCFNIRLVNTDERYPLTSASGSDGSRVKRRKVLDGEQYIY